MFTRWAVFPFLGFLHSMILSDQICITDPICGPNFGASTCGNSSIVGFFLITEIEFFPISGPELFLDSGIEFFPISGIEFFPKSRF